MSNARETSPPAAAPAAAPAASRKSRWLILGALALLVLTSSLSIWLNSRRKVVALRIDVLSWGGEVDVKSSEPSWLGRWLDPRYDEQVVRVRLLNTGVTGEQLARLTAFDALEELFLYQSKVGDAAMKQVARLTSVRRLNLYFTEITADGLVHLQDMPALESIWIGPQVTNREIQALATIPTLQTIDVVNSPLVDDRGLEDLLKLKELKSLRIGGSQITAEAEAAFREARPDVQFDLFDLR